VTRLVASTIAPAPYIISASADAPAALGPRLLPPATAPPLG